MSAPTEGDANEVSDLASDISDWEIEEGVPQFQDQFIQQYLSGREALIEQEKSQRSDESFRQSLSPLAQEACLIVRRILEEERRTIWNPEHDAEARREEDLVLFPGMMFTLAKGRMEKTKSWEIVKRMPKGALLHAHMDATMDVDFVINQALSTEGFAMSSDRGLVDKATLDDANVVFRYRKSTLAAGASVWTNDYQTSDFVSIKEAAASFPNGGLGGFKVWLKDRCTITPEESLSFHCGVDHVWQKFASAFVPLNSLEYYEPIFRPTVRDLLSQFVADGINWVDFRCVFAQPFFLEGSEEPCKDNSEFLQLWSDEIAKVKGSDEGRGFWGCRFIWTSLRFWGKKQIVEHMKRCIEMKKKYPDLICGYDSKQSLLYLKNSGFPFIAPS